MKKILCAAALMAAPLLVFSQNKILINPSAGYAWRTAEKPAGISAAERAYLKDISKGFNFDIGAYYMFRPDLGLGVKYNQFTASGSYILQGVNPDDTTFSVKINTDDKILFVGPAIYGGNLSSASRHKFISGVALGYISYTSTLNGVKITGANIGAAFDLGYQYQVSPNISVGPQAGFTAGTLATIKVDGTTLDLPKESREGLHRISLGLGVNIKF